MNTQLLTGQNQRTVSASLNEDRPRCEIMAYTFW